MSNFSSRKIPIFSNINDTPIAPSSLAGGNGSHLIANYNLLIDDLTSSVTATETAIEAIPTLVRWQDRSPVFTSAGLYLYVDLTNGNDSNNGSENSPFLTIDKALSLLVDKKLGPYSVEIFVKGTITNYLFDFSKLQVTNASNYEEDGIYIRIAAWGNDLTLRYEQPDYYEGDFRFMLPAQDRSLGYRFTYVKFEIVGYPFYLDNLDNLHFNGCSFNCTQALESIVWLQHSQVIFRNTTFKSTDNSAWAGLILNSGSIAWMDYENTFFENITNTIYFLDHSKIYQFGFLNITSNPTKIFEGNYGSEIFLGSANNGLDYNKIFLSNTKFYYQGLNGQGLLSGLFKSISYHFFELVVGDYLLINKGGYGSLKSSLLKAEVEDGGFTYLIEIGAAPTSNSYTTVTNTYSEGNFTFGQERIYTDGIATRFRTTEVAQNSVILKVLTGVATNVSLTLEIWNKS